METGIVDYDKSGSVILVSIKKKSFIINDIWPVQSRLHGVRGKRCIGKKITSFLTPASKKIFKAAVSGKSKHRNGTLQLEFCSKKWPCTSYSCAIWNTPGHPLTLVIYKTPLFEKKLQLPETTAGSIDEKDIASKEKYRILEMLPMAVCVSDQYGNIFFTNNSFLRLFGFTPQNMPCLDAWLCKSCSWGENLTEMFTMNDSGLNNMPARELVGKDFLRQEHALSCADGTVKEVEIFSHLCDGNLYLIFNDLTERKKAERLQGQAEERLRRIIEKMPMPIAAYETQLPKRFHFINPKFTEWFGYTIEDIPDISHWKKLAFKDEAYYRQKEKEWYSEMARIQAGEIKESRPIEFSVYCKDGSVKELEIAFTVDDNLFYTTYNDITDRRKIEKALQQNEQKFRNISEQLPIPIVVFGENADTRFLNNAFTDTFGYTREDIPTCDDWLNSAYPDEILRNGIRSNFEKQYDHQASQQPGKIHISQYEVTCKNGDKKTVEFFVSFGNKHVYVAFNDITGKVKAEQELKQSHRQLRQLSSHLENIREEERKHISREIHDELGQQLTLLKLDLLQISKKFQPEQQELIKKMQEADQLLIDTMRSVRKIATQLRPSILDNLGLVSAMEWQSREFEKNFGIPCVFESLLTEPSFSEQQSNALFRIYQEALTNIARHAGATQVDAVLSQNDNRIVLEVRDNGKGFLYNDIAGKKTLGLMGMRERALMIDGDFNMESIPGQGTYINISIPMFIPNEEINSL
jgi:PAS domain S-box-containing protein